MIKWLKILFGKGPKPVPVRVSRPPVAGTKTYVDEKGRLRWKESGEIVQNYRALPFDK